MMMPEPEPLCRFSERYRCCLPLISFPSITKNPRLYFTTFSTPTPPPELLNHAVPQPKPTIRVQLAPDSFLTPSPIPDDYDNSLFYYFSIDFRFGYSGFFQDWGPFNLAMV